MHADGAQAHVMRKRTLIGTWLVLMVLTVLTVAATAIDLGLEGNLAVAMFIAVIKATIVALIYMHLWGDRRINMLVFFASIGFVILFVGITSMDVGDYQKDIIAKPTANVSAGAGN